MAIPITAPDVGIFDLITYKGQEYPKPAFVNGVRAGRGLHGKGPDIAARQAMRDAASVGSVREEDYHGFEAGFMAGRRSRVVG